MSIELESLIVKLQMDSQAYLDALESSREKTEEFSEAAEEGAAKTEEMGEKSKESSFKMTELNSAIQLAQQALRLMKQAYDATVGATIDYAREVDSLARSLSISTEEASKIIQMGDDLKIGVETLELAFRGLIDKGTQPTIENLKKLADQYQAIDDPVKRAQFAMEKFGMRAGQDMQKVLELTSDQIDEMTQSAEAAGLVMGRDSVEAAIAFDESLDDLGDSAEGVKIMLGNEMIPVLRDLTDRTSQAIAGFKLAAKVLDDLERGITPATASYQDYAEAVKAANKVTLAWRVFNTGIVDIFTGIDTGIRTMTEDEWLAQQATIALHEEWARSDDALAEMTAQMLVNTEATRSNANAVTAVHDSTAYLVTQNSRLSQSYQNLKQVQDELKITQDGLAAATANLQEAEQNWMDSTAGDVVSQLEAMGVEGQAYKDALAAIDEVYGTDLGVQQQYQEGVAALVAEYQKSGDLETFKTKLAELKDVYMPLDEQVQANLQSVRDLKDAIAALESKEIWIYQHIITTTSAEPMLPAGGGSSGATSASGGASEGGRHDPDQEFAGADAGFVPSGTTMSGATTINVTVTLPTDTPSLVERAARTGVQEALRAVGRA